MPAFWAAARRSAARAFEGALAQDCALCGARGGSALICAACDAALPRIGPACRRCSVPLEFDGLCGDCLRRHPRFDEAVAVFEYRFPVDRLVHRFKFGGDLAVGQWLATRLAERVGQRPEVLVAPPLATGRLRDRGFNQSIVLARRVGRLLGIRHEWRGLERVRETERQPGLSRTARRRNLREAFECRLRLDGMRVAIVDDVLTTGATADALASTLKRAGASHVTAWVVARTPDPRGEDD